MLPAIHRMRSSEDFRQVRRLGKKFLPPGLVIHVSQGFFSPGASKIGITVGKDCGNSVARHRLSRRIRGAMAPFVTELPAGSGVVIRALPGATENVDISASIQTVVDTVVNQGTS
jgi:ribonuclease P protein component